MKSIRETTLWLFWFGWVFVCLVGFCFFFLLMHGTKESKQFKKQASKGSKIQSWAIEEK